MKISILYSFICFLAICLFVTPVFAVDDVAEVSPSVTPVKGIDAPPSDNKGVAISKPQPMQSTNENQYPSLFFTYWQHQAIMDAKSSRGHVRPPTPEELEALKNGSDEDIKPDPGPRELALGGIVFKGSDDWTIWLNEQRITPKAIPKEIIDLQVFKNYVEVKWHDEFTGRIYPVRLRAHERFNLDMRIYLPG